MSCNHCSTKFSFFHKEMGCANCGLSFCNKCVRQKCRIPSKGTSELGVCRLCYTQLTTTPSNSSTNIPAPDILQKRLESLDNPISTLIMSNADELRLPRHHQNVVQTESQLLERLKKLKNDSKGLPPSEWELRKRLAVLQGANEYVEVPAKPLMFAKDTTRTDTQQTDAMLDEFMNEREIELAHNPQEEIEARIANLRGMGVRPNEGPFITNLHDSSTSSEDEVDKITRKIMAEVALEEKTRPDDLRPMVSSSKIERPASPELPWCVLCNDDAKWRCHDCDDLYCDRCNREAHKEWGDTDHKVVPYKRGD